MKRKPIFLALALLLVVGAALWGVNTRLDHPPLTKADKEFRALVAGADNVVILERKSVPTGTIYLTRKTLNAAQTQQLIKVLRFSEIKSSENIPGFPQLQLVFRHKEKPISHLELYQKRYGSEFQSFSSIGQVFVINPRFNKRLNRALDAYLPQRIRP